MRARNKFNRIRATSQLLPPTPEIDFTVHSGFEVGRRCICKAPQRPYRAHGSQASFELSVADSVLEVSVCFEEEVLSIHRAVLVKFES
uniref:Uncharacterized protein n=1 Tax=Kalanchoe fedtschenkoi TaxID=63787 RepID=A0A7N1A112_KALFE